MRTQIAFIGFILAVFASGFFVGSKVADARGRRVTATVMLSGLKWQQAAEKWKLASNTFFDSATNLIAIAQEAQQHAFNAVKLLEECQAKERKEAQ